MHRSNGPQSSSRKAVPETVSFLMFTVFGVGLFFLFFFVALLKLRLRGGGLTKGVGNKAKKALPTPFDSPPRETG